MQEDVRLLLKSIEEASKHARTTLLILVATCIYVVSASLRRGGGLRSSARCRCWARRCRPPSSAPSRRAVVLCVCACLHLYVGELLRRLHTFDQLPDLDPRSLSRAIHTPDRST